MTRASPRLDFARNFATGLALTLGVTSFLGAAPLQQADPCRCTYQRGLVTHPDVPSPECTPPGGVLTLLFWTPGTATNGHCSNPGCTPSPCTGQGSFTVYSDSGCPIQLYQNDRVVVRGWREVTYFIQDELECGEIVDYSAVQGGAEIAHFTDTCWSCGSGH